MKLSWYKGIEPILKVDPSYTADHVTAFNTRNNKRSETSPSQDNSQHMHTPINTYINTYKNKHV